MSLMKLMEGDRRNTEHIHKNAADAPYRLPFGPPFLLDAFPPALSAFSTFRLCCLLRSAFRAALV